MTAATVPGVGDDTTYNASYWLVDQKALKAIVAKMYTEEEAAAAKNAGEDAADGWKYIAGRSCAIRGARGH